MTDRYAEGDTWPNPPASQQPAPAANVAASEPSRVAGEGSDAQEALAALARVRALADAFADDGLTRHGGNIAWHIEEAIANEKSDFPDAADRRIASQRHRAESAERARDEALAEVTELRDRLGRVEALADEWESIGSPRVSFWRIAAELRAVLAVPVTGDTEDGGMVAEDATPDHERGLYGKYRVERISDPTGKHADCRYFVLDPRHDVIARDALATYAAVAANRGYHDLSRDLWRWVDEYPVRGTGAASPTEQATEGGGDRG